MKPVILSLGGESLSEDERALFAEADPAGYILFARNIRDREQIRRLTDDLRAIHGRERLAILIDQEGGRVARMKPPEWPAFPAWGDFDALYEKAPISAIEAARANAEAIGLTLAEVGISVDALPLLDIRRPETHEVIGDRALGHEPLRVAAMARAVLEGLEAAGVAGIVKHVPGHGRARVDSHKALPRVEASADELATDIAPFKALADATMAMTCHIVFTAWDAELPASLSPTIIADVIRGEIGFDGLLISDDLDMKALEGDPADLAAEVVAAGCDLALNCWGRLDEMARTADRLGEMPAIARERLARALDKPQKSGDKADLAALIDKRDRLLSLA